MRQRHSLFGGGILALVLTVVVLGGLAGCGASAASSSLAPAPSPSPTSNLPQGVPLPDAVQVVRTDPINPLPPFSRTVADAAAVQRLYRALYGLPPFKSTPSCAFDWGVDFQLTFSHQGTTVLSAHYHATGCPIIQLAPQDHRGVTNAFVTLLATTLGVSRQELLPPPPVG